MFLNQNIIYLCFIFSITSNIILCNDIELLETSKFIISKFEDNKYFKIVEINRNLLKANQYYKIMLGVEVGIKVKCELKGDNYFENKYKKIEYQNSGSNDFTEFDFKTNENKLPLICKDEMIKSLNNENFSTPIKIYLILNPILTSYQLKSIEELIKKFNFAIELTESKFNTDNKVINILTNKNIYILILIIFTIIPLGKM